jgi:hypothetical protein
MTGTMKRADRDGRTGQGGLVLAELEASWLRLLRLMLTQPLR